MLSRQIINPIPLSLRTDAHHGRFDAVVVWKFDRFARSVSHLLRALETFQAPALSS